ncbi:MAG: ferredoxin-thioredoxin reductase catalytic domain-containing protein [Dehalococcoidales bacterium]|nr:ferredoxin-thioredoxin reductase catalytic domain-containing protein [Dehalococcoidales bacterium]
MDTEVTGEEIDALYRKLKTEAEAAGYYLNPDIEMVRELLKGIIINEKRYGYGACPCRLASGVKNKDTDIICPCDYRDPDITDYNACYCSLYVSQEAVEGKVKVGSIPERRPPPGKRQPEPAEMVKASLTSLPLPVWRCKVCGYLCARENPPEICPICKAKKERFERFI